MPVAFVGVDGGGVRVEMDEDSRSERFDEFDVGAEDRAGTVGLCGREVLGAHADDDRSSRVGFQCGVLEMDVVRDRELLASERDCPEVG